jgi:hypothetical protein
MIIEIDLFEIGKALIITGFIIISAIIGYYLGKKDTKK